MPRHQLEMFPKEVLLDALWSHCDPSGRGQATVKRLAKDCGFEPYCVETLLKALHLDRRVVIYGNPSVTVKYVITPDDVREDRI